MLDENTTRQLRDQWKERINCIVDQKTKERMTRDIEILNIVLEED
jgi:hypothetical protein